MMRCLGLLAALLLIVPAARAQANDGFQRRDGSMYLIRNGEAKPMTRDVRLPNGRLVSRDGFVVDAAGQRTELKDGQGCSLLGVPVGASAQPNGRVLLAATGSGNSPAAVRAAEWRRFEGRGKGKGRGKHKHKRKHDDENDD